MQSNTAFDFERSYVGVLVSSIISAFVILGENCIARTAENGRLNHGTGLLS
ncbi:hypothetical protein O9929_02760 [Vibrio lentus]|nr:hypothetical protein [Vibrio lentus]